jgi:Tfp pilus assembly protein PilF
MSTIPPDPASALIQEALQCRNAGDPLSARRLLETAVKQSQSSHNRVRAYIDLGRVLDQLGKRQSAQSCFRRVMSLTDDWTYRDEARKLFRHRPEARGRR